VGDVEYCFIDQEQNPVSTDDPAPMTPGAFPWSGGACVPEADTGPNGNPQGWQHPEELASGDCWICAADDYASRFVWSPAPDGTWESTGAATCEEPFFTLPDGVGGTVESLSPAYSGLPGEGRCFDGSCRGLKLDARLPVGFSGSGHTHLFNMNGGQYSLHGGLGGGFGRVAAP